MTFANLYVTSMAPYTVGAGKTYTMLGTVENPGIMFLTMMELYKRINEVREEKSCDVAVSYCEVTNTFVSYFVRKYGVTFGCSEHGRSLPNPVINDISGKCTFKN